MDLRQQWAVKAHERGWLLTPLNGKLPTLQDWPNRPAPTLEQVQEWAARGNVGLRTGDASRVFVIDFDFGKLGDNDAAARAIYAMIPPTPTVVTGGGGEHKYLIMPAAALGNSVAKLAPGVDTRGNGGQVVFPGSVHPETERAYVWAPGLSPDDVPLAEVPAEILALLLPRPAPEAKPQAPRASFDGTLSNYVAKAVDAETAALRSAPESLRHQTLIRAAFSLGQLVGGGAAPQSLVEAELYAACEANGMIAAGREKEVRRTIRDGLASGGQHPRAPEPRDPRRGLRAVPNRTHDPNRTSNPGGQRDEQLGDAGGAATGVQIAAHETNDTHPASNAAPNASVNPNPPEVLTPGLHPSLVDNAKEFLEIGNHDFVDAALVSLPPGTIYRRGDVPGEIVGPAGAQTFRALSNERMRIILDQHLRVCRWIFRKTDPAPWLRFEASNSDHARLVLESAATHPSVRSLKHLASYPVFLSDLSLAAPGWNELGGVYYDCAPDLADLELPDHARARAILDDLVIDFPWKPDDPSVAGSSSSRENYFGLLLTPMLRPAIAGNVPMHMILSTTPGTGKTLLAGTILGGIYLGKEAPARHLGTNEEERQKTIISMLMQGETIVHLDNLRDYLDSANIASLLTSTEFSARRLGVNDSRPMPNNTILVTTGNNVKATQEIVRRSVPVWIIPTTDDPAGRTDFHHPDLQAYVAEQRREVLAAMVSMVVRWRDGERPKGLHPKGSFDRWAEIVGGVLLHSGFAGWRTNEKKWQRDADTFGEDLRALCEAWWDKHAGDMVTTSQVLDIVEHLSVFPMVAKAKDRSGRISSLSRSVLARHTDAPVAHWFLRRHGTGNSSFYYLEGASGGSIGGGAIK